MRILLFLFITCFVTLGLPCPPGQYQSTAGCHNCTRCQPRSSILIPCSRRSDTRCGRTIRAKERFQNRQTGRKHYQSMNSFTAMTPDWTKIRQWRHPALTPGSSDTPVREAGGYWSSGWPVAFGIIGALGVVSAALVCYLVVKGYRTRSPSNQQSELRTSRLSNSGELPMDPVQHLENQLSLNQERRLLLHRMCNSDISNDYTPEQTSSQITRVASTQL